MIVVDSNLVACLALSTSVTQEAERVRAKDRNWTAPAQLRPEFMSIIGKAHQAGQLSRDAALRTFRRGMNLVTVSKLQADPLFILNLSQSSGCSPYDLEFVWLAMELGVPLITSNQQVLDAFPNVAIDPAAFTK